MKQKACSKMCSPTATLSVEATYTGTSATYANTTERCAGNLSSDYTIICMLTTGQKNHRRRPLIGKVWVNTFPRQRLLELSNRLKVGGGLLYAVSPEAISRKTKRLISNHKGCCIYIYPVPG
jgi:hypothetical protein